MPTSPLRDFLEIPYDQLEEMNLEVKAERLAVEPTAGGEIVREVAECPKCRVRARSKDHQLQ